MIRHATSHGFSVLMCTIIGALLIDYIRPYTPWFYCFLEDISRYLVITFTLPFSIQQFNVILVASILAMIWGVFFKLRYRKYY